MGAWSTVTPHPEGAPEGGSGGRLGAPSGVQRRTSTTIRHGSDSVSTR